jgi:hypothetical protein
MPNLYFCQSKSLGILRAVLSSDEGRSLLKDCPAHYLGEQFPTTNSDRDYAVLRIFDEESHEEWKPGFYRFDADIMQIEKAVQACTAKMSAAGTRRS